MDNKPFSPKIFHTSDIHLSFISMREEEGGQPHFPYANYNWGSLGIAKPMDQRTWSKGNDNYVGYLQKLRDFCEENLTDKDLLIVTGDLTHDMSKKHILTSLRWLDKCVTGIKVLIRGNHDWAVDFGELRHPDSGLTNTVMIEEGGMTCLNGYAFGCYSNHSGTRMDDKGEQAAFTNREEELLAFAAALVKFAAKHKKTPILLSHYPVPLHVAHQIGKAGVKAYLSGHIHCTNNKVLPAQADWSWYNKSAAQTDDKKLEGCFFSTGTTDVLLNRTGKICKQIDDKVTKRVPAHQNPPEFPKLQGEPAGLMWVTVGLPGSGKSTWAKKQAEKVGAVYVCQDELGGRHACEMAVAKALAAGKNVIVDRTNINRQQRKHWIDLAKRYKVKIVTCVEFDIPADVCLSRINSRTGHPTINERVPMDRRQKIVERFAQEYQKPELNEGFATIAIFREKDLATWIEE